MAELKTFAEAEKQNEEIKRLARTSENVANELLKQEMAQTGLFEKVKEKLFIKDVDRRFRAAETLYRKRTRNSKARDGKAESAA